MATRLDIERPRRRTYYPWKQWQDGKTWRAVQGEDFTCSVQNFQTALHIRARQQGLGMVTGSPEKNVVEFCFILPSK